MKNLTKQFGIIDPMTLGFLIAIIGGGLGSSSLSSDEQVSSQPVDVVSTDMSHTECSEECL